MRMGSKALNIVACFGLVAAKPANIIAVGAEVWRLAGDDDYTGSTSMDFLLYVKQTTIDESLLVNDTCPEAVFWSNHSDFSLKLVNARGSPNVENNAALGSECPKGAQLVGEGFWCRTISTTLSYRIDTETFPFDFQDFPIVLQDDGSPVKRKFCYLESVSEKPMFDQNVWSTSPKFQFHQGSECYPPCNSDLQRRSTCSFIWHTKRSWRKEIPRFCMVPLGVVILCVAILAVRGPKERLTASVGLIWTINQFYSASMQGLSLRSKKVGLFESSVWWNYLVILTISIDSCYSIWKERESSGERFRDQLDWEIRSLILLFTGLQSFAVLLVANGICSTFFRTSLFPLQMFFLFCVLFSWIMLKLGKPAPVQWTAMKFTALASLRRRPACGEVEIQRQDLQQPMRPAV